MSIFPTTILLATDGSRHAELARSAAVDLANLANSTDSELHLVTVAPGYPSYDVRSPSVLELLRRQAEDTLNDQAKKVEQEGGKVAGKHLRIAERYRAQKIVQVAEDIEAGLIVMGNRGLGGIRRALIGSISDSVMPTAPSWWCVRRRSKQRTSSGVSCEDVALLRLVRDHLARRIIRRGRKKITQVLPHPLLGPAVALLRALLVLKDAHRTDLALPGVKGEVRHEPRHVADHVHELLVD
jgi:nucleotide-binding universal stress UspA family protein